LWVSWQGRESGKAFGFGMLVETLGFTGSAKISPEFDPSQRQSLSDTLRRPLNRLSEQQTLLLGEALAQESDHGHT
jgi:N-acetyl-anhydromuramyl-L-alanine amidase AmpD